MKLRLNNEEQLWEAADKYADDLRAASGAGWNAGIKTFAGFLFVWSPASSTIYYDTPENRREILREWDETIGNSSEEEVGISATRKVDKDLTRILGRKPTINDKIKYLGQLLAQRDEKK